MLRNVVLIITILIAGTGIGCVLFGDIEAYPLAIWSTILLIAVLFERWRYHQPAISDMDAWEKTDERFLDPEWGK